MKKVMSSVLRLLKRLVAIIILLPLGSATYYYYQQLQRPKAINITQPLWQGIQYQRIVRTQPRLHIMHLLELDLSKVNMRFFVTAKDDSSSKVARMELCGIRENCALVQ